MIFKNINILGIGFIKKSKRNEIEIINKEYFMEKKSGESLEEQIKLIEKEIAYIKSLINKTNAKIKKIKENLYLTYDDLIQNDITKNIIVIKTKNDIKPNIKIVSESQECFPENNEEYFDPNISFNISNDMNNHQNEYIADNYEIWNITNQSSNMYMDKIKNESPIELFLISPKLKENI